MDKTKAKNFKPVIKIYESTDYQKSNEVSQGLAETHEQVSDSYMAGDMTTNEPSNQDKG